MTVGSETFAIIAVLFACWSGTLRGAEEPAPGVTAELNRFETQWQSPVPPEDPRFGIIRVLSLLNLEHPGLDPVKAAASARDYPRAERELLAYFRRTRAVPPAASHRPSPQAQIHADDALRHFFRGNGDVFPPVYRGAKIDWTGRAFAAGKEIHDGEWYLQFQRLTWWPALAAAYATSGDERYFREWRFELAGWAEEFLPLTRKTPGFVSRGMETCCRCANHIGTFPAMLRSEHFGTRTLLVFLASFHDQADHIPTVYAKTGNHRLFDLSQVFRNGIAFPEFKRADGWRNDALVLLPRMIDDDVYDDGMNKELVFSYHGMYVGLFMDAWKLFREHGYADRLPPEFQRKILRMAEIHALQSFPDFTTCQFGDGWKHRDPGDLFRRNLAPLAAEIPYFDYMISRGAKGTPPARTSAAYPQSGFYFFRSGWDPKAVFAPLKCGATAFWHNQPDNGTFELCAYGRNLMTDSGCYLYGSSDPEEQRWRAWFRSTKAHQTLTLDYRDAACAPEFILWRESDGVTALVVENQSYPGLKHRRTVLFVERRYLMVHDEALGDATGAVRLHFQFVPGEAEIAGLTARTQFQAGPNLLVRTFPRHPALATEREEGWISYEIRRKERRPAWAWMIPKGPADPAVSFLTVLAPYPETEPVPVVDATVAAQGDVREFTLRTAGTNRTIRLDLAARTLASERRDTGPRTDPDGG